MFGVDCGKSEEALGVWSGLMVIYALADGALEKLLELSNGPDQSSWIVLIRQTSLLLLRSVASSPLCILFFARFRIQIFLFADLAAMGWLIQRITSSAPSNVTIPQRSQSPIRLCSELQARTRRDWCPFSHTNLIKQFQLGVGVESLQRLNRSEVTVLIYTLLNNRTSTSAVRSALHHRLQI